MIVPGLSDVTDLYVDSSLLIAATIGGTHHSRAAAAFFGAMFQSATRLYFSHLLRYEVLHALERLALGRNLLEPDIRNSYALDEWDNLLVRQRWFTLGMEQLDAFFSGLDEAYELPVDPELFRAGLDIMSFYRLSSYNALHVATALRERIYDFATCDRDFQRVEQLRVHYVTNRALGLSSGA